MRATIPASWSPNTATSGAGTKPSSGTSTFRGASERERPFWKSTDAGSSRALARLFAYHRPKGPHHVVDDSRHRRHRRTRTVHLQPDARRPRSWPLSLAERLIAVGG